MDSAARTCDWRLYNIVILGFSFMFLFTSFQTCSMVQTTVIEAAKAEANSTFSGDGYTSLAIIYGAFASFNWATPSIVAICGPKISMLFGAFCYCLFIASFLKPMTWALYAGSVLVGIGAAVIWTAQGSFLTTNSDVETMGRNSGIFWALMQCSLIFGNLYVYFAFNDETTISTSTRTTLFTVLTAVAVAGSLLLFLLRKPPTSPQETTTDSQRNGEKPAGALNAFKTAIKLLFTRRIGLLAVTFAYTGFELSLWSGVFGTSAGHTRVFGAEAKSLLGLCGMFFGFGSIMGGACFGLLGKKTNKYGRDPIVLLGYIVHIIAFYLIFLSLPADSPMHESLLPTYIAPNKYTILVCAVLLGLGDSSFNTQIYSLLGSLYPDDSAAVFALFKFIQSVASAVGFVYSLRLLLHWQLLILVTMGTAGSLCFFAVEWTTVDPKLPEGYSELPQKVSGASSEEDC